jgi:hypothetical protein
MNVDYSIRTLTGCLCTSAHWPLPLSLHYYLKGHPEVINTAFNSSSWNLRIDEVQDPKQSFSYSKHNIRFKTQTKNLQ